MPNQDYLEPVEKLSAPTMDMHRAIAQLIERLASLDSHNQNHEACTDPELKLVLGFSRDREKKHIALLMEWIRRRDAKLDHELREALFKAGPIVAPYKS